MKTRVYVVFGAAVRPDGTASGTLRRRTLGALALSEAAGREGVEKARRFLVTGGPGRYGPAEACVMRDLLVDAGVPEEEIVLEPASLDTLESALRCARILRSAPFEERSPVAAGPARAAARDSELEVVVATSSYHVFRCWLLLRCLGISAARGRIPASLSAGSRRAWLYSVLREIVATPWDVFLVLTIHRKARRGRS